MKQAKLGGWGVLIEVRIVRRGYSDCCLAVSGILATASVSDEPEPFASLTCIYCENQMLDSIMAEYILAFCRLHMRS